MNCKAASIAVEVPSMLLLRAEIITELFYLYEKNTAYIVFFYKIHS